MPAPYDYTIGEVASPQQSFIQGIQMVDALRKREQDQAAAIEAKRKEQELQALYAEALKPDAKPDVFERLSFAIDPKQAALSRMQKLNDAQQDAMIGNMGSVLTPLVAGKPDLAIQRADELIKAMENSPNPDQKSLQALKASRQVFSQSPQLAQVSLTTSMMGLGEKGRKAVNDIFEAMKKPEEQRKAAGEAAKTESEAAKSASEAKKAAVEADFAKRLQEAGLNEKNWNTRNLQSQISDRSQRLALERTKVNAEIAEKLASVGEKLTALPESAQKLVNEAAVNAAAAKQSADQFNTLANKLSEAGGGYGVASNASDFLKKIGGFQGGMTQLRQEYTRLRNSAVIQSLPPGPSTDKDIAIFMEGFPSANASANDLASFLRGMAKSQDMAASLNNAKTDWLTENKGQLGRARAGFIAGDYSVKPGETYADFSTRVSADVAKRYAPKPSGAELIPTAQPLMRPGSVATPTQQQPAPRNIRSEADAILRGGQ